MEPYGYRPLNIKNFEAPGSGKDLGSSDMGGATFQPGKAQGTMTQKGV